MKTTTNKFKTGQKIQAIIVTEILNGIIIGIGLHKGRLVYDLDTGYGHGRFVYENQILGAY